MVWNADRIQVGLSPTADMQALWIMEELRLKNKRLSIEYCIDQVFQYLHTHPMPSREDTENPPSFPSTPALTETPSSIPD